MAETEKHKVLRLPEVQAVTGLGRSAIYEQISAGKFPRAISLSSKSVGWIEAEVQVWIEERVAERNARLEKVS